VSSPCDGVVCNDDERGAISLVVAFGLGLIGLLALGIADLTLLADARSGAQTAADAAALAALQQMVVPVAGAPAPSEEAASYATRNGSDLVSCVCTEGAIESVVEVRRAVPALWLLPDVSWVSADARAIAEPPTSAPFPSGLSP